MENNLENKAKFFAQYWGQKVVYNTLFNFDNLNDICQATFNIEALPHEILHLKPIASITDEDAKNVCLLSRPDVKWKNYSREDIKNLALRLHQYSIIAYQYLQSKGYALPYMGLSVERLIEYGWIKMEVSNA